MPEHLTHNHWKVATRDPLLFHHHRRHIKRFQRHFGGLSLPPTLVPLLLLPFLNLLPFLDLL